MIACRSIFSLFVRTSQSYTHPTTFPPHPTHSISEKCHHHSPPFSKGHNTITTSIMLHHPLSSITTMPSSSSSSSSSFNLSHPKLKKLTTNPNHNHHPNPNPNSSPPCKHTPSATLDILILILVLFSCTFLITSYFSYIFHSLSRILPSLFLSHSQSFRQSPFPYILGFVIFFTVSVVAVEICCSYRSRKCDNPGCKGLKKALEFDLQLLTEECLKSKSNEIDCLPFKGGNEGNPDYECLRSELKRMAPPNGRAVLLFRSKCGCPIAKLEAWGPKRSRRNRKGLGNSAGDGGGDNR